MESKSFEELNGRISSVHFPESLDMIVAIANGGIIPAAIVNQKLKLEFQMIKLNLRDEQQKQLYEKPVIVEPVNFDIKDRNILLVDDRVKTGTTLAFAKKMLEAQGAESVITFAVNGKADISLYDEACFIFPWSFRMNH